MARKKPAKKAKAKSARRTASKKAAPASAKRASARKPKKAARRVAKATTLRQAQGRPERSRGTKKAPRKAAKPAGRKAAKKAAPARKAAAAIKKPNLDRPRKTVADIRGIPSSLDMNRSPSAAKSGRAEMKDKLAKSTSGGAAITAGDVDADWESAETVGDEAPGGDNPTPDQDVVDDIGRALGVEYEDDEELQGGAEIADRDRHRWELDPSSKDDFDEET
jgi:hypothetical protein